MLESTSTLRSKIGKNIRAYGINTFSSLKNRNYRLYFTGQGISLPGTWMERIAQSWLVLSLTNSGIALGLVTAFQTLPILFLGPWGGLVADRFNKRKLLFFTQAASGLLSLLLAVLIATGLVRIWMVYILAALLGIVNAVDNPTRQTFVFEMVGENDLSNAITLNSTLVNLARIIGPAIAGVIIAGLGLALCFFLNAVSFSGVLICLYLINPEDLHAGRPVKKAKGQLREGFRYILSTPILRNVLLILAIAGTLTYEFKVSLPLLAKFTFLGDANYYAFLTSAMGLGAVVGGLLTAGRKRTSARGLSATAIFFGLAVLATALSPGIHMAVFMMVVVGIFSIRFMTLGNTTLQLESAPEMRSRVMSMWSIAFLGSSPVGGPIIGFIAEHTNPRIALSVSGSAAVAAGILGLILRRNASAKKPASQGLSG
ncbi:MAG TPA: MFS transporter [Ignavibacteriales bacterium]|nr:MFS transporter [Ignavibacteriales bacterium]